MSFLKHFKTFFSFRFSILLGFALAFWLFLTQTEVKPLATLLRGAQIYLIALLIILGARLAYWVIIEKAGMYSIKNTFLNIIVDYITCILVMLCCCSCLFLLNTFLF
ncbi:MAG: hypothetical protein IKV03_00520 [Alphaproteobacteria bacterium]|nr:hypothetical protein [Alphaproteobacteria bacterium]